MLVTTASAFAPSLPIKLPPEQLVRGHKSGEVTKMKEKVPVGEDSTAIRCWL
jgi:hypothetical protein